MTSAAIRELSADDVELVRWALYTALAWDPARTLPPPAFTLEHPEARRYHEDWGRRGDLGVVATEHGEVVGVASCRLFTADDHGHGYVDDDTPEVAVAVREGDRGRGNGERLLTALADVATPRGCSRLSLSVDPGNRAIRLYERVGFQRIPPFGAYVEDPLSLFYEKRIT